MRVTELLGYARVSTNEQDLALQLDALAATGRDKRSIFTDVGSGAIRHRPSSSDALTIGGPATRWWYGALTAWVAACGTWSSWSPS